MGPGSRPHGDGADDLLPLTVLQWDERSTVAPACPGSELRQIIG